MGITFLGMERKFNICKPRDKPEDIICGAWFGRMHHNYDFLFSRLVWGLGIWEWVKSH